MPFVGALGSTDLTFGGGQATGTIPVVIPMDGLLAVAISVRGDIPGDFLTMNVDGPTGLGFTSESMAYAELPYSNVWAGSSDINGSGAADVAYFAGMVPPDATTITVGHLISGLNPVCGILFFSGENSAEFFTETLADPDEWGVPQDGDSQTMADLSGPFGNWWNTLVGYTCFVDDGFGEPVDDADVTLAGSAVTQSFNAPVDAPGLVSPYASHNGQYSPIRFPMAADSESVGYSSPGSNMWVIHDGPNDAGDALEYYFSGKQNFWCVYYNPDIDPWPNPPEEPDALNQSVPELHIPHKEYAFNQSQVALTPKAQHFYFTNLKSIESWADGLRCSGSEVIDTGEGGEQTVTYTPTDGKWKERQLHIPHKEHFTSRHVRENYLAVERWANAICPPLHIPHKDWVLMGTAEQELTNLVTIEQWARGIGRCCEGVIDDDPGEG